jgi:tripartite-type tricarboxylate transporter receptor subunit TctC
MKKPAVLFTFASLLLTMVMSAAHAQTWPQQPVKIILPVGAGSVPDAMMRLIGDKVALHLGKPVVLENRPGAGGIVGVQSMELARDGHTLLFMFTGVSAITPMLLKAAKYDVLRDFTPIAGIAETSFMLAASPKATATTIPDIIKLAKASPGTVVVGHVGPGSTGHMMTESFTQSTGEKFSVVGFSPSTGPVSLMNGDATYYIDGIGAVLPLVKSGKATPVAVFSPTPLPGMEAYRLAKDDLPGLEGMGSFGIVGPKDMPASAVQATASAFEKALADRDVIARLREFAIFPAFVRGDAYAARIKSERAQWGRVAKAAGMEAQ